MPAKANPSVGPADAFDMGLRVIAALVALVAFSYPGIAQNAPSAGAPARPQLDQGEPDMSAQEMDVPIDESPASRARDLEKRLRKLEKTVEGLRKEVKALKSFTPNLRNRWFVIGTAALLRPVKREFDYFADTGIGLGVGVGRYLGRYNALSLSYLYDLYPAVEFKYRIEAHLDFPYLIFGPIFSYRRRTSDRKAFDRFINDREELPSVYRTFGMSIQVPLPRNSLYFELSKMDANKDIYVGTAGILMPL